MRTKTQEQQRLSKRVERRRDEFMHAVSTFASMSLESEMPSDEEYSKLLRHERETKRSLHVDRLNSVRKKKAAARLRSLAEAKMAEVEALNEQIKANELALAEIREAMAHRMNVARADAMTRELALLVPRRHDPAAPSQKVA